MSKYIYLTVIIWVTFCVATVGAQTDTTNINIDYMVPARTYILAGIHATGSATYEESVLIGFSGLTVGKEIHVPGAEITSAVKKFWNHGYFSDVKIYATRIDGDSIWLTIALKQQPRVSKLNYYGLRQSEREDIEKHAELSVGSQITPDLIDRTQRYIKNFFAEKGYSNTDVIILQKPDTENPGSMIVDVSVDKKRRVKVRHIIVNGNSALSLNKIDRAMKKTNRSKTIVNMFRSKKFVRKLYEEDKKSVIAKYNEVGYRDAVILRDSVAVVDDEHVDIYLWVNEGKKYYFGDITWTGNTIYSSEILSQVLGIKPRQ